MTDGASTASPDPQDVLRRTSIFADVLDEGQLRLVASQSRLAFFREGTQLMSQGEFGAAMFVIVDGLVGISFADREGRETIVARLGPGAVVGEMSLFTGDRRSASAAAIANVTAVEIGKAGLERLFSRSPDLMDRFGELLARRQSELKSIDTSTREREAEFTGQARRFFASLFGRSDGGH